MTDQKTKIKDFYMSRDKSELCNHKPKANKQEKKKKMSDQASSPKGEMRGCKAQEKVMTWV